MNNIYKIYNKNLNNKFTNHLRFFEEEIKENYDIEHIFPEHLLQEFKDHKKTIDSEISVLDTENYLDKLKKYDFLFESIEKSKINLLAYKALENVEKNATILSILKGFKPSRGFSNRCIYNNASNISGRIIVENGPNILTLPKRCRTIFESRFESGKLISLDFSNLEPRLCLKLSGGKETEDIYEDVNNLLEFDIDRSIIKRAIISVLYGASYENLKNISASKAKTLFEEIKKYFNLPYIKEVSTNIDSLGVRRNFYGRPIWNLEETKENILINNYIQSTAVDIALLYFSEIVSKVDTDKAVPIFIIHDAIVFDIETSYLSDFNNIINTGYNSKELGHFPVTTSEFNIT